jgi:bifunctional non-homologous end joining protein LigD
VIGARTWPDNSRSTGTGALLVGTFDDAGQLHHAGKLGTGFSGEMLTRLRSRLDAIALGKCPGR